MTRIAFLVYRSWGYDVIERLKNDFEISCIIIPDSRVVERDFAELGIPVRKINALKSSPEQFEGIDADYFVLMGWSWMIDDKSVDRFRMIGMHPSKLPKYRGGSPIQHQIMNGEKESAATIFDITHVVDTGAIYAQVPFSLEGELSEILARMVDATVEGLKEVLPKLGTMTPIKQDESQATNSWRRVPSDSEMSPSDFATAEMAYNKIRALADPYPNAFLNLKGGIVKLTKAKEMPSASFDFCNVAELFETKADAMKNGMVVVCNNGSIIKLVEVKR